MAGIDGQLHGCIRQAAAGPRPALWRSAVSFLPGGLFYSHQPLNGRPTTGASGKVVMENGDVNATVQNAGTTRIGKVNGTNGAADTDRLLHFHYLAIADL